MMIREFELRTLNELRKLKNKTQNHLPKWPVTLLILMTHTCLNQN